jgi:hypothetical protein
MPSSHASLFAWPLLLSEGSALAPPLAALWARRSFRRDPAGQVAACWLVMWVMGLASLIQALHWLPRTVPVNAAVTVLFPLLLLPPTLTWISPRARRWRWPLVAGWIGFCALMLAVVGNGRAFAMVIDPVMAAGMAVLSVAALGARVRVADGVVRAYDWFWILTAHAVYFALETLHRPLLETLAARQWSAVFPVQMGFMLADTMVYLLLAWAMLRPAVAPRPVSAVAMSRVGVA